MLDGETLASSLKQGKSTVDCYSMTVSMTIMLYKDLYTHLQLLISITLVLYNMRQIVTNEAYAGNSINCSAYDSEEIWTYQ